MNFPEVHNTGPLPVHPDYVDRNGAPLGYDGPIYVERDNYGVSNTPVRAGFETGHFRTGAAAASQPPPDSHAARSPFNPLEIMYGHQGARFPRMVAREVESATTTPGESMGILRTSWRRIWRTGAALTALAGVTALYNRLPEDTQNFIGQTYENVTNNGWWAGIGGAAGAVIAANALPDGARDRAFGAPGTNWYPRIVGEGWRATIDTVRNPLERIPMRIAAAIGGTAASAVISVVATPVAVARGLMRRRA